MEKESEVEDTAVPLPRSCPRRQIRRRRRWRRPAVGGSGSWIRFDTGEEGEGGSQPTRTAPPPPARRRGSMRPAPPPRAPPSPMRPARRCGPTRRRGPARPAVAPRDPSWPHEPPWAPPCAPPESGATSPCRRKERKDDGEGGGATEGEGGRCARGRRRGCHGRRGKEVRTCSVFGGREWLRQKGRPGVKKCSPR